MLTSSGDQAVAGVVHAGWADSSGAQDSSWHSDSHRQELRQCLQNKHIDRPSSWAVQEPGDQCLVNLGGVN